MNGRNVESKAQLQIKKNGSQWRMDINKYKICIFRGAKINRKLQCMMHILFFFFATEIEEFHVIDKYLVRRADV